MNTENDYWSHIKALEIENQALKQKLEQSHTDLITLKASNKKKEVRLRTLIQDLNQAEQQLQMVATGTATTTIREIFSALVHPIAETLSVNDALVSEDAEHTDGEQNREAYYRALIEVMPDLMIRLHADGTLLDVVPGDAFKRLNPTFFRVDVNIYDVIPDHAQQRMAYVQQALATQEIQTYDYELVIDGEHRFEEARIIALNDQEVLIMIRDITERKQSEEQLRQLSTRLNLALKSANIGIWEWNISESYRIWDARMYELYGASPEQFPDAYEAWINGLHPDVRPKVEEIARQTLRGEREYDTEFRVVHPDGTIHFIKAYAVVQRNEHGDAQKMIGINYDITDRKLFEKQLQESEERYRSIFDQASVGLVNATLEGKLLNANRCFCELMGYSHEELLTKTVMDITHPDYRSPILPEHQRLFEGEVSSFLQEKQYLRKDGSNFWANTQVSIVKDSDGNPSHTLAVIQDITIRKQAENQINSLLKRTQLLNSISAEIRDSLDLEIILQTSVNAIFSELMASSCTFAWYGQTQSKLLNVVTEQKTSSLPSAIGRYELDAFPSLVSHIENNHIYRVDCLNDLTDEGIKVFLQSMGLETFLCLPIHTAGSQIGSLQIGRIFGEKPWDEEEIKLIQDIGNQMAIAIYQAQLYGESQCKTQELKQSYQELQDAQLQLIQSEKMSSLGQLVAGIAHEINNPVNFISGNLEIASDYVKTLTTLFSQLLNRQANLPSDVRALIEIPDIDYIISDFPKLINSMDNGAERIYKIVQSLRTFSRLDQADYKGINLHENIDSTLVILQNRLNGRAGNPEIQLVKNYGDLPLVECYGGLLNQVFMNLLVNAIDAIEETQTEVPSDYEGCITIQTQVLTDDKVSISIKDNGSGMDPQTLDQIFNPFFTTKPIGIGTGMGLSISYQIVTGSHNGQLLCSSTPDVGTEFVIELWRSLNQVNAST